VIVLDTHTWIWWTAKRHKLTPVVVEALENTDRLAIASITLWEIAMLVEKKRITLERNVLEWLQDAIEDTRAEVLPLTPQIAVAATAFAELSDPSDRLIAATALTHGVPLVTKDERIQRSGVVATIW
jgi:PIN domain nuclease of toxin-antitoxin system